MHNKQKISPIKIKPIHMGIKLEKKYIISNKNNKGVYYEKNKEIFDSKTASKTNAYR